MNHRTPLSELTDDDAFDAQLRATIAWAEPMPPPPRRFLRRVRMVVARRVALALLLVAVVCGALELRFAIQANHRLNRFLPGWMLVDAGVADRETSVDVVSRPAPDPEMKSLPPLTEKEVNGPLLASAHSLGSCLPESGMSALLMFGITEAGHGTDLVVGDANASAARCLRMVISGIRWPLSRAGETTVAATVTTK